jgi:AAA15 family ATPase/GTPase
VSFAQNSVRYEYGFSFDAKRVHQEWLMEYVNPRGREIFARKYDGKSGEYEWKFGSFLKGERSYLRKATRPEVLFLSRATQLNSKQLLPVFEWFQKRLVVLVVPTSLNTALTLQMLEQPDGKENLLSLLREADLGIADVEVKREPFPMSGNASVFIAGSPILEQVPGNQSPNLVRVTLSHYGEDKEKLGLDLSEESAGTQVFFRTAGAWFNIFKNAEVVLFDEIDTSLHPKLTRFLIEKFHSNKTNANNAQLIFTTHNTSLLDQDLFRRDQIWFVEKGLGGESKLYPLTDFKPRNDEVLERWYMRGRYGALPILREAAR